MEGKNTNKNNILLIVLGCIIGAIILSFGVKTMIDYSSGNVYNEERPYGAISQCSPGYYIASGGTSCNQCTAGWYCSGGYGASRYMCDPGTYSHAGASYCTACPQGTYQTERGQSTCTSCPAGTYNFSTAQTSVDACKKCTAGYYCGSGTAIPTVCPAGHYCKEGTEIPQTCPKGYYCETGVAIGTKCPAGTYNSATGQTSVSACKTCPAGSYCTSGTGNPTACPSGTYNPETNQVNEEACLDCVNGAVSEDRTKCYKPTSIIITGAWDSVKVGETRKFAAAVGPSVTNSQANGYNDVTWSVSSGTSFCSIDSNGVVTGIKKGVCTIKAVSKVNSSVTQNKQVQVLEPTIVLTCPSQIGIGGESGLCTLKFNGEVVTADLYTLSDTAKACLSISKSGVLMSNGYTSCKGTASAGYTYEGVYYTAHATVEAILCKDDDDDGLCDDDDIFTCDVGQYIENTGSGNFCETCPKGYMCDGNVKTACSGKEYQDTEGQSSCKTCVQGIVNSEHTSCTYTPCSSGYFMGENGCQQCNIGYYCNGISQERCEDGAYQNIKGQSSCKTCDGVVNPSRSECSKPYLEITGSSSVKIGEKIVLTSTVYPSYAGQDVEWSIVSGADYAIVSGNLSVTGVKEGPITVKAQSTKYLISDTKTITIVAPTVTIDCPDTIYVGETGKCTLKVNGNNANADLYTSNNNKSIEVNSSTGEILGKSVGSADITVRYVSEGGAKYTATKNVVVNNLPATLTCPANVIAGKTATCKFYVNGNVITANAYSSASTDIATFENGVVTGKKGGVVKLTARYDPPNGGSSVYANYEIKVIEPTVTLTCPSQLGVGSSGKCLLAVNGENVVASSYTIDLNGGRKVLSVTSYGVITAIKAGTATVSAEYSSSTGYKRSAHAVVTVTECSSGNCLVCDDGQYVSGNGCAKCPKGYSCDGTEKKACTGNTYQDKEGQSSCKVCTTIVNDSHTSCGICSLGYWRGENSCEKCPSGYYCDDGISKTTCPNGKTSNLGAKNSSECYVKAEESECNVNASIHKNYVSVDQDENSSNSYYSVKVTVSGNGCNGQSLTYSATNAKSISPTSVSSISSGSIYYFNVYPAEKCSSSTATATLTNGKISRDSISQILTDWEIEYGCWSIEDVAKSGIPIGSHTADSIGVNNYYDSYDSVKKCYTVYANRKGCGISNPNIPNTPSTPGTPSSPTYACYMDDNNNYVWATSVPAGYILVSEINNSNECSNPVRYACYKNSNNEYVWATNAPSGFTVVDNITSVEACVSVSENACYKNSNNEYVWATNAPSGFTLVSGIINYESCVSPTTFACYKNENDHYVWSASAPTGYTVVAEITAESQCIKPLPSTYACYKNNTGNYKWATTAPTGYTLVTAIIDEENCKLIDDSACYVNNSGTYAWGDYHNDTSYTLISEIKKPENCLRPAACYENSTGKYVWGQYSNNPSYTIIEEIVSEEECNNVVNVPSTGEKATIVIYILVIISLICGYSFMYYSYSKKKLNRK